MEASELTVNDYAYCEDCDTYFDWWKYETLEDTGHDGHRVRNVDAQELETLLKECEEDDCLEEEFLCGPYKHQPLRV